MRVDHLRKQAHGSERPWLADFIMGAYTDARLRGEPKCWEILTARHVIEVHEL